MINTAILNLAVLFAVAGVLGVIARMLRQPLLLAYILTGALAGVFGLFDLIDLPTFHIFSDLGVTILLFLVGLEVNYTSLRLVGKPSVIVGVGQVILASIGGYFISRGFNFPPLASLYIGLALSFSSTIIVIALLSDKKDMQSLYGKISIGMMLVQDVITIFLLIILAGVNVGGSVSFVPLIWVFVKGVAIFAAMLWMGARVLPIVFDRIARSGELLFLIATAWMLLVAAFVSSVGFSIEIGGFLAGVALAGSAEHFAISARMRSLRDFFIFAFFMILGSSLASLSFVGLTAPIVVLSLFVLIGNPLIVLVLMGLMGYRRKTSFLTAVTTAQVSEFSLILVQLGKNLGHVEAPVVALVSAVALVSIVVSTYMFIYAEPIIKRLDRFLKLFERRRLVENSIPESGYHKEIVLVGAARLGSSILSHMKSEDVLVVDANPDVVKKLRKEGYSCLLGSLSDEDMLEAANIDEAKFLISTSPNFDDNRALLEALKRKHSQAKVVVRAEDEREVEHLYEAGATYVLLPQRSSGHLIGKQIADHPDLAFLDILRKKDNY